MAANIVITVSLGSDYPIFAQLTPMKPLHIILAFLILFNVYAFQGDWIDEADVQTLAYTLQAATSQPSTKKSKAQKWEKFLKACQVFVGDIKNRLLTIPVDVRDDVVNSLSSRIHAAFPGLKKREVQEWLVQTGAILGDERELCMRMRALVHGIPPTNSK